MNKKPIKVSFSEGSLRVSAPVMSKASGRKISFKGKLCGAVSKESKLKMTMKFCTRDSVYYESKVRISSKHTKVDADNLTSTESITVLSQTPKAKHSAATDIDNR